MLDGTGVLVQHVQESSVSLSADRCLDARDQQPGQALATVVRVGAHRADLNPARQVQATPGHRDKPTLAPHSQVAAQLNGRGRERAGTGEFGQRDHLGGVLLAKGDNSFRCDASVISPSVGAIICATGKTVATVQPGGAVITAGASRAARPSGPHSPARSRQA